MAVSVFFDRKVANEDNSFLEKLELNRAADLGENNDDDSRNNYKLPNLSP